MLGIPMPPSALLAMVGPRVANHVLHTLHDAYPDRFPLSPTLENFANGEMEVVLTGDARKTVDEIHEAILDALADECRHLLDEGVVASAAEIDACLILGAGFPFFRGGLTRTSTRAGSSAASHGYPDSRARRGPLAHESASVPVRFAHSTARRARDSVERADPQGSSTSPCAAHMHETDFNPTHPSSEPAEGLEAAALRAHAWYGEPFLHAGEEPAAALAPGTARRGALDDALAEMDAGRRTPSARWRVRYGLMLGLERVLASPTPADGLGNRAPAPSGRCARGHADRADRVEPAPGGGERERERQRQRARGRGRRGRPRRARGGGRRPRCRRRRRRGRRAGVRRARTRARMRRYRFRHPTASGKTIAAAGFVESARHLGILILTHRRLLVSAVPARPDDGGLRRPLHGRDRRGQGAAPRRPDHDPDVRLVRAPRGRHLPQRLPARDLRRGPHGARREDERGDPVVQRAGLHRHDGDGAADREAGVGRLPRLGRRPSRSPTPRAGA